MKAGHEDPHTLILSAAELFRIVHELLDAGQTAQFTVSGNSMWPLIRHNTDSVLLIAPPACIRRGDIVLLEKMDASRTHPHYILHRVMRKNGDRIVTAGDHCTIYDPPSTVDDVIGVVDTVYRGKRTIVCRRLSWRILSGLWRHLFFLRPLLLRVLKWGAKMRVNFRKQA